MKRAFISDVHGNIKALEAALKKISADEIYCLGDIVENLPNSNECIKLVRESCKASVLGNHDTFSARYGYCELTGPKRKPDISKNEHLSPELYTETLKEENQNYLANCLLEIETGDLLIAHTILDRTEINPWKYIMEEPDALYGFGLLKKKIAVIGHTHIPKIFEEEKIDEKKYRITKHEIKSDKLVLEMKDDRRYILDAGSAGYNLKNPDIGHYGIIKRKVMEIHRFNI